MWKYYLVTSSQTAAWYCQELLNEDGGDGGTYGSAMVVPILTGSSCSGVQGGRIWS